MERERERSQFRGLIFTCDWRKFAQLRKGMIQSLRQRLFFHSAILSEGYVVVVVTGALPLSDSVSSPQIVIALL